MEYSLVGYGSLISHKSLTETIKDRKFIPVIVRGYKRIFNLFVDNKKDVLNVKKSADSKFNGVLMKVNDEELKKIKLREDVYEFTETEIYDFKTKKKLGKALIVIDRFIDIDKNNLLPDKRYFILCRESAYHISKEFGLFWDKTTYTSDNEKISEWIKNHREYGTIKSGRKKPKFDPSERLTEVRQNN
jgi:hypothetical protein